MVGRYAFDTDTISSIRFESTSGWYLADNSEGALTDLSVTHYAVDTSGYVITSNATNNAIWINEDFAAYHYLKKSVVYKLKNSNNSVAIFYA